LGAGRRAASYQHEALEEVYDEGQDYELVWVLVLPMSLPLCANAYVGETFGQVVVVGLLAFLAVIQLLVLGHGVERVPHKRM